MKLKTGRWLENRCGCNSLWKKWLWRTVVVLCLLMQSLGAFSQKEYAAFVNPFIGTGGHGHTFPGATLPFGMMQLSPDTRLGGWDGASGYHYSDSLMYGFSHTHLSGTGAVDYGDVLLMPFIGETKWQHHQYASPFSHTTEKASPGYYKVTLDKHEIQVRLTTTARAGMHQYSFPEDALEGAVLIDLQHRDEVLESYIEKVSDTELKGYRRSSAWAKDQRLYFYIQFDKPIASFIFLNDQQQFTGDKKASGKKVKMAVRFTFDQAKDLKVKVGVSAVDEAGARKNLLAEMSHWNFDQYKSTAREEWNKELGKIEVEGGTADQKTVFYTALYHSLISPNIYQDVDGRYRSTDLQIHQAKEFTNHTVFSLWDTYRTFHPLMSLINEKRTADWINTFLAQYQYGGMLPVWELSANETFTMIGYHSVPVIWDAYQKGIRNFDAAKALEAAVSYAESNRFGLPVYQAQGYVSNEAEPESVSKTVEYAYDDWCIAQLAKALGNQEVYQKFIRRAQSYKNLFDPQTRHIRGKRQAIWHHPFDPREINTLHTEGNAWQYAFAAPQDIKGLIALYGGEQAFLASLNELFTTSSQTTGFSMADVSGFIGQYAHGNEPSHHMAYLFNYAGQPWRTQELVHRIAHEFYQNAPDGLIGNEDCGQMSAWYVMSAMGFYPVCPGDGTYVLGTPLFDKVTVHLDNKKQFVISADRPNDSSFYIQRARWNNKPFQKSWISHQDILKGGVLQLTMGDQPNKSFGANKADRPSTSIQDDQFIPVPYLNGTSHRFRGEREVVLHTIDSTASIYYAVTDSPAPIADNAAFIPYAKPFLISETTYVQAFAKKKGANSSLVTQGFVKLPDDKTITVLSQVHPMYTAGEPEALIDGILGTSSWRTGGWQAYPDQDFEAIVDLQKVRPVSYVGVHVLQFLGPSVVYPKELLVEGSMDGKTFFPIASISNPIPVEEKELQFRELGTAVKTEARFIKVKALNGGALPAWHSNPGGPSRIFISEVLVR